MQHSHLVVSTVTVELLGTHVHHIGTDVGQESSVVGHQQQCGRPRLQESNNVTVTTAFSQLWWVGGASSGWG